jgi:hypothetical protein
VASIGLGRENDFAWAVHVVEGHHGEVARADLALGRVGEHEESSKDGGVAGVDPGGGRVFLLESYEVLLESGNIGSSPSLKPGILETHVGEERAHVREGCLHGVSSDRFVALGYLTRPVAGAEDFEVVDGVNGGNGGEMGVGSESLAKGAPDLLGVVSGTPGRSHDCMDPGFLDRHESIARMVSGCRWQCVQEWD